MIQSWPTNDIIYIFPVSDEKLAYILISKFADHLNNLAFLCIMILKSTFNRPFPHNVCLKPWIKTLLLWLYYRINNFVFNVIVKLVEQFYRYSILHIYYSTIVINTSVCTWPGSPCQITYFGGVFNWVS